MTDNERVDLDLQEIAEDFVLAWIGRPSTAAAAQLHQHLRHQRRQGRAEGLREMLHKVVHGACHCDQCRITRAKANALEKGE